MNPLLPGHSGTTPEPTRNALNTSQGTNEDDSQNDRHPEAGLFHGQMTQNSGPEDGHDMVTGDTETNRNSHDMVRGATETNRNRHDMVTGATETNRNRHDMVTGATETNRNRHDMVRGATEQIGNCHNMTGIHEEVTYCPLVHLQESRRKTALPVNHNSAVKTRLRRSKQTKFCLPFSSWQIITILRTFTITSTEFPSCQSH